MLASTVWLSVDMDVRRFRRVTRPVVPLLFIGNVDHIHHGTREQSIPLMGLEESKEVNSDEALMGWNGKSPLLICMMPSLFYPGMDLGSWGWSSFWPLPKRTGQDSLWGSRSSPFLNHSSNDTLLQELNTCFSIPLQALPDHELNLVAWQVVLRLPATPC